MSLYVETLTNIGAEALKDVDTNGVDRRELASKVVAELVPVLQARVERLTEASRRELSRVYKLLNETEAALLEADKALISASQEVAG